MKKIIRLTESDLTRIVRRVLKEQETGMVSNGPKVKDDTNPNWNKKYPCLQYIDMERYGNTNTYVVKIPGSQFPIFFANGRGIEGSGGIKDVTWERLYNDKMQYWYCDPDTGRESTITDGQGNTIKHFRYYFTEDANDPDRLKAISMGITPDINGNIVGKSNSSSSGSKKYTQCNDNFKMYCYNNVEIKRLQRCLGVPVVDGYFGEQTYKFLNDKFPNYKGVVKKTDIDNICNQSKIK
jgi:hypothetical protein